MLEEVLGGVGGVITGGDVEGTTGDGVAGAGFGEPNFGLLDDVLGGVEGCDGAGGVGVVGRAGFGEPNCGLLEDGGAGGVTGRGGDGGVTTGGDGGGVAGGLGDPNFGLEPDVLDGVLGRGGDGGVTVGGLGAGFGDPNFGLEPDVLGDVEGLLLPLLLLAAGFFELPELGGFLESAAPTLLIRNATATNKAMNLFIELPFYAKVSEATPRYFL